MKKTLLGILVVLMATPCPMKAWGNLGHEIVIAIAQRHLTPTAKKNIAKYFDYDLKVDATYMDHHRNDKDIAYTTAWHVFDVDENLRYNICPRAYKNDVVYALYYTRYNLSDGYYRQMSDSAVVMNTRMLIHFVGDLHCPTHCYVNRPQGMKWPCTLNDTKYKTFHEIYDKIPAMLYPGMKAEEIAELLDTASKREMKKIAAGTPIDWANDCGKNCSHIIEINPYLTEVLDPDTIEKSRELVNIQLRNAGYRLARLLNEYFGE